ncbi:MAG: PIN domain-containing protein [Bryobacteraceae bacterium]
MNGLAFFDTNIFLYADDSSAPEKKAKAIDLITEHQRSGKALVSLQVLQEYFVVATRKLGVAPEVAQRKVELMSRMRVVRFQDSDVISAIEFHRLHQISFWDAMIVHAARAGGAEILYTEDLHAGATWRGLTVVNPFPNG